MNLESNKQLNFMKSQNTKQLNPEYVLFSKTEKRNSSYCLLKFEMIGNEPTTTVISLEQNPPISTIHYINVESAKVAFNQLTNFFVRCGWKIGYQGGKLYNG
jgi:hypothetical protein